MDERGGRAGAGPDELARLFPDMRETGDTTLRQCQLVMIRMLRILDHICTEEGLRYWMTAGTLIGAIRHRGMIPWDMDIDVGMPAKDYVALSRIRQRFPRDIFFQNFKTDPHYPRANIFGKLRDRYSSYHEWQEKNPGARWHNGLQVDFLIYPQDPEGRLVNPVRRTPYAPEEIFPLVRLEFEGSLLSAPRQYDSYLRRRYGDYMTPPPPEERVAHEGRADPFTPCRHPESLDYPRQRPDPGSVRWT